jgi:hypothetical protein
MVAGPVEALRGEVSHEVSRGVSIFVYEKNLLAIASWGKIEGGQDAIGKGC